MTSWITYARPFARRRRIYRMKRAKFNYLNSHDNVQWERYDCAIESIAWLWADFREAIITSRPAPTSPDFNGKE